MNTAGNGTYTILSTRDATGQNGFHLYQDSASRCRIRSLVNGVNNATDVDGTSGSLEAGKSYQARLLYTSGSEVRVYLENGEWEASLSNDSIIETKEKLSPLMIGNDYTGYDGFNGYISELSIKPYRDTDFSHMIANKPYIEDTTTFLNETRSYKRDKEGNVQVKSLLIDGKEAATKEIELINPEFLYKENTGIMIPYYAYPTDVYNNTDILSMMDFARKYKTVPIMVILNPSNGAGTVVDGNYTYGIKMLKGAGCTVIGYVSTDYTNNSLATVKADIDMWMKLYPDTEGIFLDEMSWEDDPVKLSYYKELNRYVKSLGMRVTIANPGDNVTEAYIVNECADIFMDWERAEFPSDVDMEQKWNNGSSSHSHNKRCGAVYDGLLDGGWDAANQAIFKKMTEYYGWVYYTEDTTANPWDSLSTFMQDMVDIITDAPSSDIILPTSQPAVLVDGMIWLEI